MSTEHWNMGIAGIIARDTGHDTPTQQPLVVQTFKNPVLSPSAITSGGSYSMYGGPIPDHSEHWRQYFSGGWNHYPTGKTMQTPIRANPKNVLTAMQEPEHLASAGSSDSWRSMFDIAFGSMRNGSTGTSY